MTTLREAAQQALEALEDHATQYPHMQKGYTVDAITALRAALEQSEQEPVAWIESPHGAIRRNTLYRITAPQSLAWSIPLYAHPPRREWQSLSLQAVAKALADAGLQPEDYREDGQILPLVRAIEHALKERNHG